MTDVSISTSAARHRFNYLFLAVGLVGSIVHLVHLLGHSQEIYANFELTHDFAFYSQAFTYASISNIDPASTFGAGSFLHNHFEISIVIFAILFNHIFSSFSLLFLQDLAIFGTDLVVLMFAFRLLQRTENHYLTGGIVLGSVFALGTLLSPWALEATTFDFHSEVIGGFFVTASLYCLWRKHLVFATAFVVLAIATGSVTALFLAGAMLGFVLSKHVETSFPIRALGLTFALLALGEIALLALSNFENNDYLAGFSYLTPGISHIPTFSQALLGAVTHPIGVTFRIIEKLGVFYRYAVSGGLFWLFDPIGLGTLLLGFGPSLINGDSTFINPIAAFQIETGIVLFSVASLLVLAKIIASPKSTRAIRAGLIMVSMVAMAFGVLELRFYNNQILATWGSVNSTQAQALALALSRIPKNNEVIVSQGVVGRFANRLDVHDLNSKFAIAIDKPNLTAIVVPSSGIETISPKLSFQFIANLMRLSPNSQVVNHSGVYVVTVKGIAVPNQVSA